MNTIDRIGDLECLRKLIDKTIEEFEDDEITKLRYNSFRFSKSLTNVKLPAIVEINGSSFQDCSNLVSVDLGENIERIYADAFRDCSKLTTVIIRNTTNVVTLYASASSSTFRGASSAIIYVPDDLVESYKAATYWSSIDSRIKGLSELPSAS